MPRIWRFLVLAGCALSLAACSHQPPRCKGAYFPINDASHYVHPGTEHAP